MGVGGVGPAPVAVVEQGREADTHGFGEQDGAVAQPEAAVGEIGQVHVAQLAGAQAVEGSQRGERCAGRVRREQGFSDFVGVGGQRVAALVATGVDAGDRVDEEGLARFEEGQDRAEPGAHGGAGVAGGGQHGADVGRCDLPQPGVALLGPDRQGWHGPAQVEPDGLLVAGPAPRRRGRAVEHDVEPLGQLVLHRVGEVGDGGGEPGVDRGLAVIEHDAGGGSDVDDGQRRHLDLLQQHGVAGQQHRAGGVLHELEDTYRALGPVDRGLGPAVTAGVVEDRGVEEGSHRGSGGSGKRLSVKRPWAWAAARSRGMSNNASLGLVGRVELDRIETWSAPCPVAGAQFVQASDIAVADPGGLPGNVGEVELLAVRVGFLDRGAEGDHHLSVAQVADLVGVDREIAPLAGTAGSAWEPRPPAVAAPAQPLVLADHTPGQAIATGFHALGSRTVAARAQALGVVLVTGGSQVPPQRRHAGWLEGTAGPALVAVVDARGGPCDEALAARDTRLWLLAPGWSPSGAGRCHAGGRVRLRPRRGWTAGVEGFEPPGWSPPLAAFADRRAATLSGSRIKRLEGSQSRTAQITSRSSRRMVVGVPVHRPTSSPRRSQARRRPAGGVVRWTSRCRVRQRHAQVPVHRIIPPRDRT